MKHVEGIVIDRDGTPIGEPTRSQPRWTAAQMGGLSITGFVGTLLRSALRNPIKLAVTAIVVLPIAALMLSLFAIMFLFATLSSVFGGRNKSFVKVIRF